MKKGIALFLVLALIFCVPVTASAASKDTQASVPVTLTVIQNHHPISVTVPAALPVSVVNGTVVTATNAAIRNNAKEGHVKISDISVHAGTLSIGDYENFKDAKNSIALKINGCVTRGEGPMTLREDMPRSIAPGESLPLSYQAKVAVDETVTGATAATVVFTIAADGN